MNPGVWVVAGSAAVAVVTGFVLRTRLPGGAVLVVLAAAGAGMGWSGILLQPDPSTVEVVLSVVGMAVLVPVHARILLGRFGPAARGEGIRALSDP